MIHSESVTVHILPRLSHAVGLPEVRHSVAEMVNYIHREDQVEEGRPELELLSPPKPNPDPDLPTGLAQHPFRWIDAVASATYLLGNGANVVASAAAHFKNL
jgi:hypothetical protein